MRYRLTSKGKAVITAFAFVVLCLLVALFFGIFGAINSIVQQPDATPPPTSTQSDTPTAPPRSPGPSASDVSPSASAPPSDRPAITADPTDAPPSPSAPPAEETTAPPTQAPPQIITPPGVDVYQGRYAVSFPKGSAELDGAALETQLKELLSAEEGAFKAPDMKNYILYAEGTAAADEEDSLAQERAQYVRSALIGIGFSRDSVAALSSGKGGGYEPQVVLYFVQIDGK
jgi:hypothetical protein